MPAVTYGVEMWGAPMDFKRQMRTQALRSMGAFVARAATAPAWALVPEAMDPMIKMDWAPLHIWHREIWDASSPEPRKEAMQSHKMATPC